MLSSSSTRTRSRIRPSYSRSAVLKMLVLLPLLFACCIQLRTAL
ncbi:MAG: hypothetical protein ACREN1_01290 [Candidatus Dormibacteria bacterium]